MAQGASYTTRCDAVPSESLTLPQTTLHHQRCTSVQMSHQVGFGNCVGGVHLITTRFRANTLPTHAKHAPGSGRINSQPSRIQLLRPGEDLGRHTPFRTTEHWPGRTWLGRHSPKPCGTVADGVSEWRACARSVHGIRETRRRSRAALRTTRQHNTRRKPTYSSGTCSNTTKMIARYRLITLRAWHMAPAPMTYESFTFCHQQWHPWYPNWRVHTTS